MQDGAQDAVQVDVHDVLEKFPLPDVVPVLKKHGGQEYEYDDLPHDAFVVFGGENIGKRDNDSSQHDAKEDGDSSLMNIVALGLWKVVPCDVGNRKT